MSASDSRREGAAGSPARRARIIEREASDWLALREQRPLTPAEQASYVAWLAADPRHRAAIEELEGAWRVFDRLAAYPRSADGPPDPNFFGRSRRFRRALPLVVTLTAAAAAIAIVVSPHTRTTLGWANSPAVAAATSATPLLRLPDGSEVELKAGSEVVEQFVPAERRVKLVRGEAHFTVAKDPTRPFVVEANGVAIRAIGTAFNVRLDPQVVEVLVTEGTVKVNPPPGETVATPQAATVLTPRQRTVVPTAASPAAIPLVVETLTPVDVDRALAWQANRLIFDAMPLAEVVARFNRVNRQRLVVPDATLAKLRISGRFRADNVDDFVELLERSFGVAAERQDGGKIVLRRVP